MKTTLLIILVVGAAVLAAYITHTYFPTFNLIQQIQNFHIDNIIEQIKAIPPQIMTLVGASITGAAVAIGKLWSKLTQVRAEVTNTKEQLQVTQSYATGQIKTLTDNVESLRQTVAAKNTEIQTLKTQLESNPLQQQLQAKTDELTRAQNTIEELKDTIKELKLAERIIVK